MEEISRIVEEEKVAINQQLGADDELLTSDHELVFSEDEVREAVKTVTATRKAEREEADKERDQLLDSGNGLKTIQNLFHFDMICLIITKAPGLVPRKKRRLSLEDDMIVKRQDHEMEMDREKMQLEKERLELEKRREDRLDDEGKRRDQLSASQIEIQRQMLAMMSKFIE